MVTIDNFGELQGIDGYLVVDGVPICDILYDTKWARGDVAHDCASGFSDVYLPGKFTVKTTIKKAMRHSEAPMLIGYSLNDTPITGTAGTLLATSHVLDATDNYEDMTTPTIATPSRIRYTLQTNAITVAGTITIIGEDADGNALSEIIEVPASAIGATFTSQHVYKKVHGHTIRAIDSTSDLGTFAVTSITGNTSYTVGNPKIFDLVGGVEKDGKSIIVTHPDCWFSSGGLTWDSSEKILDVSIDVSMHKPSELQVDVVTA